jgi:hypothetical protein
MLSTESGASVNPALRFFACMKISVGQNQAMFKKRFPVQITNEKYKSYLRKKVIFRYEISGKLVILEGAFEIHKDAKSYYVCIVCPALIFDSDPQNSLGHLIYVPQAHTDSITPSFAPDFGVDFLISRPFYAKDFQLDA